MLNIIERISLSTASKRTVKRHRKNHGLITDSWSYIDKAVKNEISKKLLARHSPRCVYCERYFIGIKNEIDHFAHKAVYPQFTFITVNLFNSCSYCNSSTRKGQKPTINGNPDYRYDLCSFLIVHPYFNVPDNELKYKDDDKVDFDWDNCSELGQQTITFFKWDDIVMTTLRSKVIKLERLNPLSTEEEKILIAEIITYK